MFYCDTSILAAYYCPEVFSNKAEKVLIQSAQPYISNLVEVEFCSAVSLKKRTGQIDTASANKILALFQIHMDEGLFRMVAIGPKEFHLAKEWISRLSTPLRTLDALHLASAFANNLNLLTSDKQLAKAAKQFGVKSKLIT